MFSLKTSVFFFSCIAVSVAFPHFFNIGGRRNNEGERPEFEQPYRNAGAPLNQQQQTGQSSVFSEVDADVGANSASNSAEQDAAGSLGGDDGAGGSELDTPDSPDTGGAVVVPGAAGGNNAGDTSTTLSPNVIGGDPGLIVNSGQGTSAGAKFGIFAGVLTVVGLAAGGAFYAYRKRRAANYGSRF
ncbi:uncharacterized protein LOC117295275 [Asterias rubens]|uniref:uncharacterized protein LOC117295275 n=1 Tax=Asterias rubens TaxID=7604 RepID=UPI001455B527|nr:uncharacterized protein LOC117295275 [Asterias rubens]